MKNERKLSLAGWRRLKARQKEGIIIIFLCLIACCVQCAGYGLFVSCDDGIKIHFNAHEVGAASDNVSGLSSNFTGLGELDGLGDLDGGVIELMEAGDGGGVYEYIVTPEKDNVSRKSEPDNNYGSYTAVVLSSYINLYQRRTYIEFPLDLPEGAYNINGSFFLYYYVYGDANPTGDKLDAYKLTRPTWVEMEQTWNIYKTGSAWTVAGGDYVTSNPSGGFCNAPAAAGCWLEWDISDIVTDAWDTAVPVELLVRFDDENQSSSSMYFYSSEYENSDYWPYLLVTYDLPDPPGAPANFTIRDLGANSANLTWSKDIAASETLIIVNRLNYPVDINDGEISYWGSDNTCLNTGLDLALTCYYFTAWSHNEVGYSVNGTGAKIGGDDIVVITMPETLTLGFPFAFYIFIFGIILLIVSFRNKSPFISIGVFFCMIGVVIEPTFQNTWFQYSAAGVMAWALAATVKRFFDWRVE